MAPVQPKKPVGGAYGIFLNENRPKFQKACTGQTAAAVAKMAGEEWKKLSPSDKKPYEKKAEEAKATFEKEMQAFLDAGGVKEKGARALRTEKRKEKEGKKAKKHPDAPKRPQAAFGQYMAKNRETIKAQLPAGHKITDVTKKASELWGKLSDAEKKPYDDMFKKASEEYKKAMEEWKKTHAADAAEEEEDEDEEEEEEEEDEKPAAKKARKAGA